MLGWVTKPSLWHDVYKGRFWGLGAMTGGGSASEHFDTGLSAYRTGDFTGAVTAFLMGLAVNKDSWEMRLYLGMAYARLNQSREARQEFLSVRDLCPDPELRKKAASALAAMTPTASQTGIKRLSEKK